MSQVIFDIGGSSRVKTSETSDVGLSSSNPALEGVTFGFELAFPSHDGEPELQVP